MKSTVRLANVLASLLLVLLLAAVSIIALSLVSQAWAQESVGSWNNPENLSLSAGTSEPVIVVDSSGRAHVVWKDAALNFMYVSGENGEWTTARAVELPFGSRRYYPDLLENQATPLHTPVLWSGTEDRIHALWINDDQSVYYSSVPATGFGSFDAWSVPQLLATSGLGMAAIADEEGRLHVTYARPAEDAQSPSGVYYRRSLDGGQTWSSPTLLYQSPYFRSLSADLANLQLASTDNDEVIIAWDNPFQERVYAARSGNAGESWDPPVEIDRRLQSDGADADGPNGIRVIAAQEDVHVMWQAGHDGLACARYHQMSVDGGQTWQLAQRLMEEVDGCSESTLLVPGNDEVILLLSPTEDGGYVAAWDGTRWGEPQPQEELARFLNPLNYREVRLACHQIVSDASGSQSSAEAVIVIGCDTGLGGDIWALSAELEPLVEEISPQATPVWQRPGVVSRPIESESVHLLADADGWLHSLWVQSPIRDGSVETVHYSRWDGIGWSQAKELLSSPDGRTAVEPAITLDPNGKILAVWTDAVPGSIYFSQADLASASNAAEWSSPVMVPMPPASATSPVIATDQDGIIYVAYAVPLNEGRGIYLTQSGNGGETWLGPAKVFDGAEAGWPMVDTPRLAVGVDGTLHLLWTKSSPPPIAAPQSIHYARSSDGGESWSEVVEVAQSPAAWSDILASGDLAVHRFWMAANGDLWHQSSADAGVSWEQSLRVSSFGDLLEIADSTIDGAGRPWLMQAAGTRTETGEIRPPIELRSWVLSEGRWISAEDLRLGESEIEEFAAVATGGGTMNVVFSSLGSELGAGQEGQTIYHSGRELDLPQVAPTPLATLTPTPLPEATRTATPAPMPTATASFPTDAGQRSGLQLPIDTSNPLTGPLLGIIPAALVVLVAFFIAVRLLRGDRR